MKQFFKPNKFKIIFSGAFITITLFVFIIGDALRSNILEVIFGVLYFPAGVFAWYFQRLPAFKTCSISFGREMCIYDQTIAVILSIPVFLFYTYILACLLNIFVGKFKK